jgi:small-conductance mechanosensitive channel
VTALGLLMWGAALFVFCLALLALVATIAVAWALVRMCWRAAFARHGDVTVTTAARAANLVAESEAHGVALVNTALAESTGPVVPVQRAGRDMLN